MMLGRMTCVALSSLSALRQQPMPPQTVPAQIADAIVNDRHEPVLKYLQSKPALAARDAEQSTILMLLAEAELGDWSQEIQLVLASADTSVVDLVDDEGQTAMHHAAQGRTSDAAATVRLLLAAHAKPDVADKTGRTPLMLAAAWIPDPHIAADLIKAGASVNAKDKTGLSVLHYATVPGQTGRSAPFIAALILAGADINATDKSGMTPLMYAAMAGFGDPTTVLASREWEENSHPNADVNAKTPDGWTALLCAVGSTNLTPFMAWRARADENAAGLSPDEFAKRYSMGAAMCAKWAQVGYVARVWALLQAGADPDAATSDGITVDKLLEKRTDQDAQAVKALIEVARKNKQK